VSYERLGFVDQMELAGMNFISSDRDVFRLFEVSNAVFIFAFDQLTELVLEVFGCYSLSWSHQRFALVSSCDQRSLYDGVTE
jgi:hypothetical protein